MADDRASAIAAAHAAADSALAYAKSSGEPVPQATIDLLKSKADALSTGSLDSLNAKIAELEKRVAKPAAQPAEPTQPPEES